MKGFVIYLSTEIFSKDVRNDYGYWDGKTYTVQGEQFPFTDYHITSETRVYKSKIRAENMAEKLLKRCPYIMSYLVEEIQ